MFELGGSGEAQGCDTQHRLPHLSPRPHCPPRLCLQQGLHSPSEACLGDFANTSELKSNNSLFPNTLQPSSPASPSPGLILPALVLLRANPRHGQKAQPGQPDTRLREGQAYSLCRAVFHPSLYLSGISPVNIPTSSLQTGLSQQGSALGCHQPLQIGACSKEL